MGKLFTNQRLLSFIIILILLVIPTFVFYNLKLNNLIVQLKTQEVHAIDLQKTAIDKNLSVVIDDLLLLKEHVILASYPVASYQRSKKDIAPLENEFIAFCIGKHRTYDQLRLLDENGMEIIRINFTENKVQKVPENELQNKSDRYYFKAISKLKSDEIYLSPFDLNIEFGEIETPHKPMLRLGTPIYNKDGKFMGEVIINYLGKNILNSFNSFIAYSQGHNFLLNQDGYYLRNTYKPSSEWSFMFDSISQKSFHNNYNEAWDSISVNESGQLQTADGIFTYSTIYPTSDTKYRYIPVGNSLQDITIVNNNLRYWKVVSFLNNSLISAQTQPLKKERNIIIMLFTLLAAILSTVITKIRRNEYIAKIRLKKLNDNLERMISERTKEYLEAKIKAEESERLKTAFLNNMSHEIRTPLNGILGFAGLLEGNYNNKSKLKQFAKIINNRSHDLLNIINDVLDISKIESGQFTLHEEKCILSDELKDLFEFFNAYKAQINKPFINLIFEYNKDDLADPILIDNGRLKQVLINLLNNAFKFTSRGEIVLKCHKREDDVLSFTISDTGIGIPKDNQEIVFDRFVQSDMNLNSNFSGTGLGLSIVKGIINLFGGTIWLESTVNVGTTFYITIPFKRLKNEYTKENILHSIRSDRKSYKILVVEDDFTNIDYIKEIFHPTHHRLYIAINGQKAIQLAKENAFDIILMDIKLPDINGLEVTKQIRKVNKKVRIIVQTAYATREDQKAAFDSGCNDFITKPLNSNKLLEMIT